ncbi:TonB-dependent receptor [Litorilituus lipolyticus]|uniref:TonB-dependent siderophore receptor n=1 Tax=Litorilituus lipolyticus TaxID=2491017 RepID=A0A502L4N3_9GAMM|nr:TonB-dependent siderophore receptor [Litorilituus lipolyticus]TPH18134.1 TonB-dependent siderophore receptor [Litorilituus lipolyticus]
MKLTPLSLSIALAISSFSSNVLANASDIEVIEVQGTYFNDYKVDNASGATRTNTSLLETAQSVTVIPETIIDEQLATTLGEVLLNDASLSPGSRQRNREVFSSRGFSLSSSNGYLRDGHQHWSHYQQPIETLSRVEVIKGPSSLLYGQSAPGGLINMVTKQPTSSPLLDLSADTDQNGSTRFMLDAGGEIIDDLSFRSVLVKQDVNFEREYQNDEQRERDRFLGSLVLDYQLSESLSVNVYYDQTNDKAGLDTGAWLDDSGEVIGSNKTIYDFSWAFTDITVNNIGGKVTYYLNPQWTVKLGYNEQTFERQRFESAPKKPADYQLGDSYTSKPYDRFDDWQFKTAYIDLTGEFTLASTEHQVLFGMNSLDYYYGQLRTKADPIEYTPGQPEPTKPDISYKTDDSLYTSSYDYYGFYFQDLVTFNEYWQVAFGGRFDKQNKENADSESFVPKFGVLYHPNENATVYINYSESFEPASSETLNEETDKNHGMDLDAVTSEQIEIGAKWQVSDRLLLETALFDIEKSGTLITETLDSDPDYETITTQAGVQRHKGFELSAQGAVTDRLFVMASAMYLDAEYEKDENYQGKAPIDAPEWSASVWSRYELTEKLAINAGIFYQGDRFADSDNTIVKDAYARVDLGATYQVDIAGADVDFRINIENAFDNDYLAGGGVNNVAVGEERTARFEIKTSF